MSYIKRDMEKLILELTKEYSCILVSGPRQIGKSTMLKKLMPNNMNYVTLDDLTDRMLAKNDPNMFLTLHPTPLLIDEIQYAPELFPIIKKMIDDGAPAGSFWMTGSQSFKLMSLAQESLAGRIALLQLSSMSQHEIYGTGELEPLEISLPALTKRNKLYSKTDINGLYERIWKGSLPAYVSGKYSNRDIFYSSYLQTYISRDITEESPGINQTKFIEFIRACACRTSQILNTHSIATDCDISDDTAKRWLGLLEKSNIIYFLHPYSNNLLKRTIKSPKIYFFDTGLVAYLTKYQTPEILQNGAINGAILENYVINEIKNNYLNNGKETPIYYYHDKDSKEIDLIIEINGCVHLLEIKKTNTPSEYLLKGFDVIKKSEIPVSTSAIVCTKEELSAIDKDNLIIPICIL